jgi:hypothetical protein
MSLPDRVNLYFKIGNFIDVPFTPREQEIVELVASSETFADAIVAAEEMFKLVGETQSEMPPQPQSNSEKGDKGEGEKSESIQSSEDSESEDSDEENDQESSESSSPDPFEVQTDDTFTDGAQSLTDLSDVHRSSDYYEVPKVDLKRIINSNSEVHNLISAVFNEQDDDVFSRVDSQYREFKKSAQREVNYLVKEFECKKAADTYARSTTARTGVLDCSKLHTYKYNEDLFKKVNVIPEGKNHGLVFILDWSGSMCDCMVDTIKQLYNLVWFCSKVNIPFDVYAFTNSYKSRSDTYIPRSEGTKGEFYIPDDFSLMNFLTSKVNKKTLETQMRNLYRIAYEVKHYVSYRTPYQTSLSGTPLNEALVSLHTILPQFKKENQLQKVQVVVLTDGEAHQLYHWGYYNDYTTGDQKLSPRTLGYDGYLRNRKTGYTYKIDYEYWKFTEVLLRDLKQSFPDINFIGIRLCIPREFTSIVRRFEYLTDSDMKKTRKDKSYNVVEKSGYQSLFIMLQNSLSSDTSFDVTEGESKIKIKSAFIKSLKAKTLNKKVLSQFMDLVC